MVKKSLEDLVEVIETTARNRHMGHWDISDKTSVKVWLINLATGKTSQLIVSDLELEQNPTESQLMDLLIARFEICESRIGIKL